jgi:hypothetical protein
MSAIRCIYQPNADGSRRDPGFPATDQHPSAVRYPFDHPTRGLLNVDAIGGAPVQAEIDAMFGLDVAGQATATRIATDLTEAAAVQADSNVQTFLNFTPAQLDNWIANNVSGAGLTLAQVKTGLNTGLQVIGRIALAAGRGRTLR